MTWSADLTSGLVYDTALYTQSDFDAALAAAFQAWENVADIDFQQVGSAALSQIDVSMTALAGSTVGRANMTFVPRSGPEELTAASVFLDSTEGWAPFGETDLSFYAVALHEIGHAIGLDHVPDGSEIMNAVISTNMLGDGDIDGAVAIYGNDGPDGPGGPADDPPPPAPGDDPGMMAASSGGGGAGILGLLLALLALFGIGGGAGAVVLAGRSEDEDGGDEVNADGVLLTDLVPVTGTWDDTLPGEMVYEHVHNHGDGGCGCVGPCCHGAMDDWLI